jgi:hypothetical protein
MGLFFTDNFFLPYDLQLVIQEVLDRFTYHERLRNLAQGFDMHWAKFLATGPMNAPGCLNM